MSEENKASKTDKKPEETVENTQKIETEKAAEATPVSQDQEEVQENELITESIDVVQNAKTDDSDDFIAEDTDEEDADPADLDAALNEDSEDETTAERHSIPKKEYETLSKEELIKEFKHLLNNHKVQAIKEHVTEIRAAFIAKFEEEQDEAKDKFLEEGGNIIDFRYYSPLKKEFNSLYFEYRDKRNHYYQNLRKDLNANLETRTALIEELKELKNELGGEESINATFDKFKDIQERWRNAGNIPRDRYNLVWNN